VFPFWFPLILFLIPPIICLPRAYLWWRRPKAGCCANCRYDLRASTDKCPECGRPIPPGKSTVAPAIGPGDDASRNAAG
jgi:predicted amidophosphoribosyltransferase